jgi:membrane protein DedA with SNARE-associated domain
LADWLARVGPSVLFFAQIFGIFAPPVPDEVLLILAGALVRQGAFNAPFTVAAAIAGCAGGITFSFVLGRTLGAAAFRHRRLRAHRAALARAEHWFARFGVWLLPFSYFVPGTRHVSAITAGVASLDYRKFAAASYPGAVLWCLTYLSLGYFARAAF